MATDTADRGVPWGSPTLRVVLASTLVLPLGVPLISPALPGVRDAFGVTDAGASLLVTAYFLPGIVFSPVLGALADRLGRRRVIVPCLLLFGLFGAAISLRPSYPVVVGLRLAQGTAAAGVFILTVTLLGDEFAGLQRNAAFGINAAALFTGAAVYPVVGGVLAGRSWSLPFAAYLLAVPVGLFAVWALPEPARERERSWFAAARGAFTALPKGVALGLYGAALGSEILSLGIVFTALPFYLSESFAVQPVVVGLVLTAVTVLSAVAATRNAVLARRFSNLQLVAGSFLLYGASFAAAGLAPEAGLVALAVLPAGVGSGVLLPSVDAAVTDLAPERFRAGALSLRNSTTFLGRATGPFAFAGLAPTVGYPTLLVAAGLGALVVGAVGVALVAR